ncbi:MAG TPA: hypothetical protein DEQ61_23620 [Streptomyces sp.]|nr:hypothetical protein [Streptomyces sp.]
MTDQEIQFLAIGFSIGTYFMLAVVLTFNMVDRRQARKRAERMLAAQQRRAARGAAVEKRGAA